MSFLKRLFKLLGLFNPPASREFNLDEDVRALLYDLAELEQRPVSQIAHDLIYQALDERQVEDDILNSWHQLTPRQQEVAALVCLNYTNQEIAARLVISPETVKSHLRNILMRLKLHSKAELSRFFANWDFSDWDR